MNTKTWNFNTKWNPAEVSSQVPFWQMLSSYPLKSKRDLLHIVIAAGSRWACFSPPLILIKVRLFLLGEWATCRSKHDKCKAVTLLLREILYYMYMMRSVLFWLSGWIITSNTGRRYCIIYHTPSRLLCSGTKWKNSCLYIRSQINMRKENPFALETNMCRSREIKRRYKSKGIPQKNNIVLFH